MFPLDLFHIKLQDVKLFVFDALLICNGGHWCDESLELCKKK